MPYARWSRAWRMLNLVAAVLGALGGAAPAVAQSFNEFPVPTAASNPAGIALGLDGNLWFTEFAGNKIGVITPAGTVAESPLPTNFRRINDQPATRPKQQPRRAATHGRR
jgi:streptogramin lyase